MAPVVPGEAAARDPVVHPGAVPRRDPYAVDLEQERRWREQLIHCAARHAWSIRFDFLLDRHGQPTTETWRMWWNRKFGLGLGTDLTSYAREHGFAV